jgi:hypothetical protein
VQPNANNTSINSPFEGHEQVELHNSKYTIYAANKKENGRQ